MALDEYRRKRDFSKTPEPIAGGRRVDDGTRYFCVQRHDATALHFDLRLQIGDALASWAVPKGPTLDPAIKRFAVKTEDHPFEYLEFEGNIPKGEYGGGSMMLWDVGTFEVLGDVDVEAQIARGDFKFRLHGSRLRGEFALVKMKASKMAPKKQSEWLLLKKKDQYASQGWEADRYTTSVKSGRSQEEIALDMRGVDAPGVAGPMPQSVTPMLATLSTKLPVGSDWVYELKLDGVRGLLFLEQGKVRVVSRSGRDMTAQFPEAQDLATQLDSSNAVLDGEIVAIDEAGRPSFEALQPRIMKRSKDPAPVVLYLFDLLYLDGRDLRGEPLLTRKRLLTERLRPSPTIRLSMHHADHGEQVLAFAKEHGLEGVVAKRGSSAYQERRSQDWCKVKVQIAVDAVVCGYMKGEGERRATFGGLVLGVSRDGRLTYAGRVGSGFDQAGLLETRAMLDQIVVKKCPFDKVPAESKDAIWVKPELICRVKALEWTSVGVLRAPVFAGWRFDLKPDECEVETIAASQEPQARASLIPDGRPETVLSVEGHSLKLTNLDKVYYPADGVTKRDLLRYYEQMAAFVLPHLHDRPITLKRYPDGIASEFFFQKNPDGKVPEWLQTPPLAENEGHPTFLCNSFAALLYFTNLGCIDHNPWQSRLGHLSTPDFLLIDLDPQDCPYDKIVEAAQTVRKLLDEIELEGYPKTTGGDGMHIYVPLQPQYSFDQVRSFAEVLARVVAFDRPDLFTTPRAVKKRDPGKVYFDWMQIGEGRTISAPYVARAYPGAPVATPLKWREVTRGLDPKQFHVRNMRDRVDRVGDLFAPVLDKRQLLEAALPKLAAALGQRQQ